MARRYDLLFTHVLGIMDLLHTYIFTQGPDYPLHYILQPFMELLEVSNLFGADLTGLLIKFVTFLRHYLHKNEARALVFLTPFVASLKEVSAGNEALTLAPLLAAVATPDDPATLLSAGFGPV